MFTRALGTPLTVALLAVAALLVVIAVVIIVHAVRDANAVHRSAPEIKRPMTREDGRRESSVETPAAGAAKLTGATSDAAPQAKTADEPDADYELPDSGAELSPDSVRLLSTNPMVERLVNAAEQVQPVIPLEVVTVGATIEPPAAEPSAPNRSHRVPDCVTLLPASIALEPRPVFAADLFAEAGRLRAKGKRGAAALLYEEVAELAAEVHASDPHAANRRAASELYRRALEARIDCLVREYGAESAAPTAKRLLAAHDLTADQRIYAETIVRTANDQAAKAELTRAKPMRRPAARKTQNTANPTTSKRKQPAKTSKRAAQAPALRSA